MSQSIILQKSNVPTNPLPRNQMVFIDLPDELYATTLHAQAAHMANLHIKAIPGISEEKHIQIVWHDDNPREHICVEYHRAGKEWQLDRFFRFYWLSDALAYYGAQVQVATVEEFLKSSLDWGFLAQPDFQLLGKACELESLGRIGSNLGSV